jgi:hypothetical protein
VDISWAIAIIKQTMKSGEIELSGLLNSNLSLAHADDFASLDDHGDRGRSGNDHGGRGRSENDQETIAAAANDQKRSRHCGGGDLEPYPRTSN